LTIPKSYAIIITTPLIKQTNLKENLMKIIINETITYERELTQEEEFLILSTVKMQKEDWIKTIREGEDYGQDPEEDKVLENSFDRDIEYNIEEVVKELLSKNKLILRNNNTTITDSYIHTIETK
jgi:hypothetical protein